VHRDCYWNREGAKDAKNFLSVCCDPEGKKQELGSDQAESYDINVNGDAVNL